MTLGILSMNPTNNDTLPMKRKITHIGIKKEAVHLSVDVNSE
jgi:hypothetical protein